MGKTTNNWPAVLAYLIVGFLLDALSSGLALNVDLDTTLTVAAANTHRLFAQELPATSVPNPNGSKANRHDRSTR